MLDDLLTNDQIKFMKSLASSSAWEDGDVVSLGSGKMAEYDQKRRVFVIKERGNMLGVVPRNEIVGR